jgi:hypothetical protein
MERSTDRSARGPGHGAFARAAAEVLGADSPFVSSLNGARASASEDDALDVFRLFQEMPVETQIAILERAAEIADG